MTTHELLPEGTTFQINGEKLSISVPESLATKQAKAERLAEKATQWAHHGTSGRQGLNGSLQLVQSLLPRAQQLAEIETSSRLVVEGHVLMMSSPVLYRENGELHTIPVGFVLGQHFEESFRRALVLSRGDPMTFLQRPVSATLLALAFVLLLLVVLPSFRRTREEAFKER